MKYLRLIIISLFLIIMGGVLGFGAGRDIVINMKTPVDYNAINILDVEKNQKVVMDVDWILDYCASGYTEHTYNGKVTSVDKDTDRYYVTSGFQQDETTGEYEEYYYVINVKGDLYDDFETVADETWAYINGEDNYYGYTPVAVTMKSVEMEEEVKGYLIDFIKDYGIYGEAGNAEIETHIIPIQLEDIGVKSDYINLVISCVLIIIGAFLLFIMLFITKKAKKNPYTPNGMPVQPNMGGNYVPNESYSQTNLYQNTNNFQNAPGQGGYEQVNTAVNQNTPVQNFGTRDEDRLIRINNAEYRKSELERIDRFVKDGDMDSASRELQYLSGMDAMECDKVIQEWNCYMN